MIGKTISHYKILEKLGEGGMGVVYKADDTKLKRRVALKFLPLDLTRDEEAKVRFIHEAQAASALDHPNICTIYEIDEDEEGRMFIAMAYYEGETLAAKIKQQTANSKKSLDWAIDIAIQIAQGLAKAHEHGIIHRDIKPANVMITNDGVVKILDFGIAKLSGRTRLTKTGGTVGTVAYMSPEQAQGQEVDHRTDIWSFGVVLYEMITGQLPFKDEYDQAVMYLIVNEAPHPIQKLNSSVSSELEQIVTKALQKKPESRYSSAAEIITALKKYQESLRAEEPGAFDLRTWLRRVRRPRIAVPAVIAVLIVVLAAVWWFNRQDKIRWAREEALPEIKRLVETSLGDFTEAYKLAEQAEKHIPNDPELAALFAKSSLTINIKTEPPGANIYMKEYKTPDREWKYLGVSPIEKIRLPIGVFRWKIEKEGYETVLAAATTWDVKLGERNLFNPNHFVRVLDKQGSIPAEMVRVSGAPTPPGKLDDFFIDKYEVTNKQYKAFIDSGGYRNREYWKHEFMKGGRVLTWEEAMAEFIDQTGRPGPATWQAGDFPEGQENYPVSGISWYEAAAYAEFAGKSLPTGLHWGVARGEYAPVIRWPQVGGFAVFVPFSNFAGKGPVAVGRLPGLTSYGAYDMAGNVREWCRNETPKGRLIRGGAWDDNTYFFTPLSQAPPFDRSPKNGFRCVQYPDPGKIPESVLGLVKPAETMDYYKEKPVSDSIYEVYKAQFSYDRTDLNARLESRDESAGDWIHERITFDAAYGEERIIAHLFLPRNTAPPYQTVVYVPGVDSRFQSSSEDLTHYYEFQIFLSFLVKNGRAVLFPVYKGTFERRDVPLDVGDDSYRYAEHLIQLVKDFRRCLDFLENRQDLDSRKFAYYGMSWGGALGAIIPAVEDRLQVSILVPGAFGGRHRPEASQINYVTRVKIPTLMLNGRFDTLAPLEIAIRPMFDLLGTPAEHKELKLYDTDHIPPRTD